MKSRILLTVSLLNVGYINPQQLEMKGEAPKSSKQVEREAAQRQRYLQEQARKRKDEEKRLKAEREEAERRQLEDKRQLEAFHQYLHQKVVYIIGTEDGSTLASILFPHPGEIESARRSIDALSLEFEDRLLNMACTIDKVRCDDIKGDEDALKVGQAGIDILPARDFSKVVAGRVRAFLAAATAPSGVVYSYAPERRKVREIPPAISLPEKMYIHTDFHGGMLVTSSRALTQASLAEWLAKRRDAVKIELREETKIYHSWLKNQRKFKPFWHGATLGVSGLQTIAPNQNTVGSTFPRGYLYVDANLLFWSFMRLGPYLAADVRKGSVDKFGGSLEFVLGSPRAALLLGSRFGRAKHEFTSIEYNAITPMIGFELAFGLPIALFARYEAEFLQLSPNRFDRNDQINVGVRLRHYNETYFAGGDISRQDVSGSPILDVFSTISLRLGAHFAHSPISSPRNLALYDIGLQTTGMVIGYAFASERFEGRLQRHMPHIGVVSPRFALMDFGIMTGPVWERNGSQESVLGAAWLQMRWTALYFGATFGYVLHFGAGDDSIRRNMYTAGFHIMF